jgi:hypothetical protein
MLQHRQVFVQNLIDFVVGFHLPAESFKWLAY